MNNEIYEIERKFLVHKKLLPSVEQIDINQAYLFKDDIGTTRIRQFGDKYVLTIKLRDVGIKQIEVERELTKEEFDKMLEKSPYKKIKKRRSRVGRWEIDHFLNLTGEFEGLILAEIELSDENNISNNLVDVKHCFLEQIGYYNSNLIEHVV